MLEDAGCYRVTPDFLQKILSRIKRWQRSKRRPSIMRTTFVSSRQKILPLFAPVDSDMTFDWLILTKLWKLEKKMSWQGCWCWVVLITLIWEAKCDFGFQVRHKTRLFAHKFQSSIRTKELAELNKGDGDFVSGTALFKSITITIVSVQVWWWLKYMVNFIL